MKNQTSKFYAIVFWSDRISWVWDRKNKWFAPHAAIPKPLTYESAVRKCKQAVRKDYNIVSWKVLSVEDWHW